MTEQVSPIATFYKPGWENYQHALVQTIAPLSSEQLALPVAPHYVSIRELLAHMISARVFWFSRWMGEENLALARSTSRHMMLERGVQSNEAKNVTLEDEAVDMRVDTDRF